ncbi:hypothetical protein PUN28_017353 [Cardiocondyla obscurior]|uniref:Uncharacterized protein n=1 Tax=Cardiocondyla obscurior TaxID=286306 RepID=A0AAW2ERV3_9HYME
MNENRRPGRSSRPSLRDARARKTRPLRWNRRYGIRITLCVSPYRRNRFTRDRAGARLTRITYAGCNVRRKLRDSPDLVRADQSEIRELLTSICLNIISALSYQNTAGTRQKHEYVNGEASQRQLRSSTFISIHNLLFFNLVVSSIILNVCCSLFYKNIRTFYFLIPFLLNMHKYLQRIEFRFIRSLKLNDRTSIILALFIYI